MSCWVCHEQRALIGVACAECLEELQLSLAITPEQVRMRSGQPTTAVLVDPFGRAHQLDARTTVGRQLPDAGLLILDATISRQHASLARHEDGWLLRDFGSANGTYLEGQRVEGETRARDGERIRFGGVSFFFVDGPVAPPDVDTSSLGAFTVRNAPGASVPAQAASAAISIELREPSGGGGGVAVIGGRHVQLSLPQMELIALLHKRAQSGDGFIAASELARTISLESTEPGEDHVRQLVRRLRRVLVKAGITGLVESRYGSGYRLVLRPYLLRS